MENKYSYEKAIVLGSGILAYECAQKLLALGMDTTVVEHKITEQTVLRKQCEKSNIPYFCEDKKDITKRLLEEENKTIIVSASNTFLFPKMVIDKTNFTIINWHNALLPEHKGRNAEAWSIFEGDKKSGITWHMVTSDVDAGSILIQEEIEISDTTTSIELFRKQNELGTLCFNKIVEPILKEQQEVYPQRSLDSTKMHYSKEVPQNGLVDLNLDAFRISCFLRSMDYGSLMLLGPMLVEWENVLYTFRKYNIEDELDKEHFVFEDNNLYIYKNNKKITLKNLKRKDL